MNRRSLGALVALDVLLLAALAVTSMQPATASGEVHYARGSYRIVAGAWTGGGGGRSAVYIVDNNTSRVYAFVFSAADKSPLIPFAGRTINDDLGH